MKDSYHISFTSHNEVIFRDREDLTMFVNMLAIHSYKDDVGIVADSEMSTHIHLHAVAEEPYRFASEILCFAEGVPPVCGRCPFVRGTFRSHIAPQLPVVHFVCGRCHP